MENLEVLQILSPIIATYFHVPIIPIIAISLPAIIVLIVFVYESRNKKKKYDTIIEVSKNISDPEEIRYLIESLQAVSYTHLTLPTRERV